ncbi:MAG: GNAT family N-acetyltransferase, partial [Anaerolineae bacterium]|nr:GNAT family N-acetyltransferase [Anaerolineae bacterium]
MTVRTRTRAIDQIQEYQVTYAGLRDLRAIHDLERLVFPLDSYTYGDLLFLLLVPGMISLKLTDEHGALIGFVSGGRILGMGRTWIMTIGVHPAHQRRGLGRMLLDRCEALL